MKDYERDRKVFSVHSCKRCALCASLAMHSTTSPVLKCSKKHYSELMLISIALFRLHAHGEQDNEWQIHRCWKVSESKVPSDLTSVALCWIWAIVALVFKQLARCNQAAWVLIWLGSEWWGYNTPIYLLHLEEEELFKLATLKLHEVAALPLRNSAGHVGSRVWVR